MDDFSFQTELHTLKERISELSEKHMPRSPTMSDPFFSQAHDLNAQMDAMEARLARCESSMHQPQPAIQDFDLSAFFESEKLPRRPTFPQYAKKMHAGMQSIGDRVAVLEQSFSDLEDKVDGLDPSRFTPPGSSFSSEAPTTPMLAATSNKYDSAPTVVSELYADGNEVPCSPELREYHNQPLNIGRQHNAYEYIHQRAKQQSQERPQPQPCQEDQWLNQHQWLGLYHERNAYENIHHRARQQLGAEAQPEALQEAQMRFQIDAASRTIKALEGRNCDLRDNIQKLEDENVSLCKAMNAIAAKMHQRSRSCDTVEAELPVESSQQIAPAGLVFRDKEIARMDEQLKTAQETIAAIEEKDVLKNNFIQQLQQDADARDLENRDLAHRNDALRDRLRQFRGMLQTRDADIGDLRASVGERDNALRDWDTRWEKMHDTNLRSNAKAKAYQHAYSEEIERKHAETERMIEDHDEEMKKLQEFCEQKDAVIQRQEQVISRGGKLMQERDDDIEKLQRELRTAEDDKQHAVRNEARTARLLEEGNAMLTEMKRSVQDAVVKQQTRHQDGSNEVPATTQVPPQPEMTIASPVTEGQSAAGARLSLPSGLQASNNLPHGERRAYFWDNGTSDSTHADNKGPGQIQNGYFRRGRGDIRSKRNFHMPEEVVVPSRRPETQRRRHVQVPLNFYQQDTSKPTRKTEGNQSSTSEHDQPSHDMTFRPPLPAPVNNPTTARRMTSEVNLRTGFWNNGRNARNQSLSKHQSMQELPKRRLQAYVETEDESGREMGSHV